MTERTTYCELARDLGRRAPDFVHYLLGDPTSRTARQWRYRNKGSLAIFVAGPDAGRWFDHDPPDGGRASGDALDLIAFVTGVSLKSAYQHGLEFISGLPQVSVSSPALKIETPRERVEGAVRWWTDARPIIGTIAEKYLRHRGITCELPPDLRFHASCWNKELKRTSPAMIALMRDITSNAPCGIHRTWLALDGSSKATLQNPKKMRGRSKSAAIKLCHDADVTHGLGIVEGIETGLSLRSIGWRPIWAVGSAGAIGAFPVLSGVEALTVFADNDAGETGLRAARICANRWSAAGREVSIIFPRRCGDDWNDVILDNAK